MERVRLVFHSENSVLTTVIPKTLFDCVRKCAKREGMPYKRYIIHVLERELAKPRRRKAKIKAS